MTTDEYQNQLDLLKEALKFYANKDKYLFYEHRDAPIALDEGMQARFALEQLEHVDELNEDIENDYSKLLDGVESPEDTAKNLMEEMKKIKYGN